jgi:WD40 repeat protein
VGGYVLYGAHSPASPNERLQPVPGTENMNIRCLALSHDGKSLALGSYDIGGIALLRNFDSVNQSIEYLVDSTDITPTAMKWSPNDQRLAVRDRNHSIYLWIKKPHQGIPSPYTADDSFQAAVQSYTGFLSNEDYSSFGSGARKTGRGGGGGGSSFGHNAASSAHHSSSLMEDLGGSGSGGGGADGNNNNLDSSNRDAPLFTVPAPRAAN